VEAVPENAIKEWEDKQAPKTSAAGPKRSESFYRPNPAPGPTRGESGRLAPMQRTSIGSSAPVSGRERYSQTTPEQWGIRDHPAAQQYADFILSQSNKITPSEARNAALAIIAFCRDFKLDPRLIVALIICESDFDPGSTSYAGAMGLGQIMPFTRDEMKVRDAYDIVSNIYCTVRHFREFYDKYLTKDANGNDLPNLTLAIAAYNAGPGNVAKYGGMPPFPKTQGYVAKVLAWYKKLCGN
jgi:soluble lytic murein transglycosylase-like protein